MMCGLLAAKTKRGSLFMDSVNRDIVLTGIRCLQHVGRAKPHTIYWNYVALRAKALYMPIDTPAQLVMGRLACLTRATLDTDDIDALQDGFDGLTRAEREILIQFFLADGIKKHCDVFIFLPTYFLNAKKNHAVGLGLALQVL